MEEGKHKMKNKYFNFSHDSNLSLNVIHQNNIVILKYNDVHFSIEECEFDKIVEFIRNKFQCESCGRYVNERKAVCSNYGSALSVCSYCFESLKTLNWKSL
jgi:hypothetical protein